MFFFLRITQLTIALAIILLSNSVDAKASQRGSLREGRLLDFYEEVEFPAESSDESKDEFGDPFPIVDDNDQDKPGNQGKFPHEDSEDDLSLGVQMESEVPTSSPTSAPTKIPTAAPTKSPTASPTSAPTASPTAAPTSSPTPAPTSSPTSAPTSSPTPAPTKPPSTEPTLAPTSAPTMEPTLAPTLAPSEPPIEIRVDPSESDALIVVSDSEPKEEPIAPADLQDFEESPSSSSLNIGALIGGLAAAAVVIAGVVYVTTQKSDDDIEEVAGGGAEIFGDEEEDYSIPPEAVVL